MCAYCDRLSACPSLSLPLRLPLPVLPCMLLLSAELFAASVLQFLLYIFLLRFSLVFFFFVPSYFIFIVCFCVLAFAACQQSLFHSHFASCLEKSNLLSFCQLRLGSSRSRSRSHSRSRYQELLLVLAAAAAAGPQHFVGVSTFPSCPSPWQRLKAISVCFY